MDVKVTERVFKAPFKLELCIFMEDAQLKGAAYIYNRGSAWHDWHDCLKHYAATHCRR